MSSEYARPGRDPDAGPCSYTSYEGSGSIAHGETDVPAEELPATGGGATGLAHDVWQALYMVEDPEMPVSVVDLGLIYGVEVDEESGAAEVTMTLTYTGCPAREMLTEEIVGAVGAVDGVEDASVTLVWSPPWSVDLVTEEGREALREFGLSI